MDTKWIWLIQNYSEGMDNNLILFKTKARVINRLMKPSASLHQYIMSIQCFSNHGTSLYVFKWKKRNGLFLLQVK